MILRCPNCGTRFRVPADALGPSERRVRCSRCQHEWSATAGDLMPEPAAAAAKPAKPARPAAKAKPAAAPKPKPAPPPPPPAVEEAPPPPPPVEPAPVPSSEPPPTNEAAEDARLQAASPAALAPAGRSFDEMLAKAVAPPPRKAPAPSWLNVRRLARVAGWVLLVVVVGGLAAAAFEHRAVMEAFPRTKAVYAFLGFEIPPPGDGLRLTNVNSTRTTADGVPTLVIEGKVTNTSDGTRAVPAMRGSLRDAKDQELQSWMFRADTASLKPGETASFKTEVKQPSPHATGLSISFTAETK